jgi:hypothetical protein
VFAALAAEAGFTLTAAARRGAADLLQRAARGPEGASGRLAVHRLDQATARQAQRIDGATGLSPPRCARCAPPTSPTSSALSASGFRFDGHLQPGGHWRG